MKKYLHFCISAAAVLMLVLYFLIYVPYSRYLSPVILAVAASVVVIVQIVMLILTIRNIYRTKTAGWPDILTLAVNILSTIGISYFLSLWLILLSAGAGLG